MELIEFFWQRCLDGYEIVWSGPNRPRRSTGWQPPKEPTAAIASKSDEFEVYKPTKFSALFRRFSDVPATAEGMRDFANRFGLLGSDFDSRRGVIRSRPVPQHPTLKYEDVRVEEMLARHRTLSRAAERSEAGNSSELIKYFNADGGKLRVELRAQPDGRTAPVLVPTNLLEFMWFELALHASSQAKIFRCERCGTPFRVGPGTGRRETAMFCSGACKQAAFKVRRKKETADA
jgi:hypothetical protein